MELDFHAAVFIGIDFFTGGTDNDGGLRALDNGLWCKALGAEGNCSGNAGEMVGVGFLGVAARTRIAFANRGGVGHFG